MAGVSAEIRTGQLYVKRQILHQHTVTYPRPPGSQILTGTLTPVITGSR
jgi:hypothetical protein